MTRPSSNANECTFRPSLETHFTDFQSDVEKGEQSAAKEEQRKEHEAYEAWHECTKLLEDRDDEKIQAWTAEVDSLLVFSGLFLTVITLFIGATTIYLQPDNGKLTVDALVAISRQLGGGNGSNLAPIAPFELPPFEQDFDDVLINSFLFSGLLFSLISSGMGLWVKEWLREYSLDLPHHPRRRVHVQEFRHKGLHDWHMRGVVACISFFLQVACWLFGLGIIMLTNKMNPILNLVMEALFGLWTLLTFAAAILPTFSSHCPFKSPLARVVYRVRHLQFFTIKGGRLSWKKFETLVDRERRKAQEQSWHLELKALKYVYAEYWGHEKLNKVSRCFKDVKTKEEAMVQIEELAAGWFNKQRDELIRPCARSSLTMPADESLMNLVKMWCELALGPHELSGMDEPARNEKAWELFTSRSWKERTGADESMRGFIRYVFCGCWGRRSKEIFAV